MAVFRLLVLIGCCFVGHELQIDENGYVPRPEEDRITQAEKNERINAQLKVRYFAIQYLLLFILALVVTSGAWTIY